MFSYVQIIKIVIRLWEFIQYNFIQWRLLLCRRCDYSLLYMQSWNLMLTFENADVRTDTYSHSHNILVSLAFHRHAVTCANVFSMFILAFQLWRNIIFNQMFHSNYCSLFTSFFTSVHLYCTKIFVLVNFFCASIFHVSHVQKNLTCKTMNLNWMFLLHVTLERKYQPFKNFASHLVLFGFFSHNNQVQQKNKK